MSINTSITADSSGVYLMLYKYDSRTNIYSYYTVNNYAGIRIRDAEQKVNCWDRINNKMKDVSDITRELFAMRDKIIASSDVYENIYLNAKITDDNAIDVRKSVYFVSPNNPENFLNLPGGQRNPGESQEECIIRELSEELNYTNISGVRNIINSRTPRLTTTNTGRKRTIFLVNNANLSPQDKLFFIDKIIPSKKQQYCGVKGIESNEIYFARWIEKDILFSSGIFKRKFYEGLIQSQKQDRYYQRIFLRPGGNQDIYYMKYLKYKAKYLKLKESIKI
jgi:8-oxo-dGTP pyrophosphatase MutT (NUDIX family)